jgi:hypothetical protein
MGRMDVRAQDITTRQQISNATVGKRYKIRYEMMTCNGKAISKVMGWGIILKMIRDKNVHRKQGRDGNRQDRPRTLGILRV